MHSGIHTKIEQPVLQFHPPADL